MMDGIDILKLIILLFGFATGQFALFHRIWIAPEKARKKELYDVLGEIKSKLIALELRVAHLEKYDKSRHDRWDALFTKLNSIDNRLTRLEAKSE